MSANENALFQPPAASTTGSRATFLDEQALILQELTTTTEFAEISIRETQMKVRVGHVLMASALADVLIAGAVCIIGFVLFVFGVIVDVPIYWLAGATFAALSLLHLSWRARRALRMT